MRMISKAGAVSRQAPHDSLVTRGHTRFAPDAAIGHPPPNRLTPEEVSLATVNRVQLSRKATRNRAGGYRIQQTEGRLRPEHRHSSKGLLRYVSASAQLAVRSVSAIRRHVSEVMAEPLSDAPEQAVLVRAGGVTLQGLLGVPEEARGVILFAHGSGSGRFSPRNNFVARRLQAGGFATLLVDLLEEPEADDRRKVFDIALLADRLLAAKAWLEQDPRTRTRLIGYFGASTGAAAALQAAARQPASIGAVVSRGGRPDLAERYLPLVAAPTLLIVGGEDLPVIQMNKEAFVQLTCPKELIIVPGATHLFEEPGTLEQVADHAQRWFQRSLNRSSGEHP